MSYDGWTHGAEAPGKYYPPSSCYAQCMNVYDWIHFYKICWLRIIRLKYCETFLLKIKTGNEDPAPAPSPQPQSAPSPNPARLRHFCLKPDSAVFFPSPTPPVLPPPPFLTPIQTLSIHRHVFLSYQTNSRHRTPPISTPFWKRKLRTG